MSDKTKKVLGLAFSLVIFLIAGYFYICVPDDGIDGGDGGYIISTTAITYNSQEESSSEEEIYYEFRKEQYLDEHFAKHGEEFDYADATEYLMGANRVIQDPNSLQKTESEDGDYIYYLESTNEFVVVSTDGYIRTYFKPGSGIDYYNRQ